MCYCCICCFCFLSTLRGAALTSFVVFRRQSSVRPSCLVLLLLPVGASPLTTVCSTCNVLPTVQQRRRQRPQRRKRKCYHCHFVGIRARCSAMRCGAVRFGFGILAAGCRLSLLLLLLLLIIFLWLSACKMLPCLQLSLLLPVGSVPHSQQVFVLSFGQCFRFCFSCAASCLTGGLFNVFCVYFV